MKIQQFIFFVFLVFTLPSCHSQNNQIEFPMEIRNKNTENHRRIEGTRIFISYPDDFKYNANSTRLQKKEQQYFEFWETESLNFTEVKNTNYNKEALTRKGVNYEDIQHIMIQNYEGIFSIGDSKDLTEEKIVLSFGDESFYVMIGGVINKTDKKGKLELIEILKTVHFDKKYKIDHLELANFDVDLEVSGFKFNASDSGFYTFSEDSKLELNKDEFTYSNFVIGTLDISEITDLKKTINAVTSNLEGEDKFKSLENRDLQSIVINGCETIVLDTNFKREGINGVLYLAAIKGKESSILFLGTAFENLDVQRKLFIETVESLKFKENY